MTAIPIERLTGSGHNDILTGDTGANRLAGAAGDDMLNGWLGNDELVGGSVRDTLTFNTALGSTNVDTVVGFSVRHDTIRLDDDIFTGIGRIGTLASPAFHIGTKAHDSNDRVIYDKDTGKLFYDADGTGSGRAVQFALLDKNLALTTNDFDVIG